MAGILATGALAHSLQSSLGAAEVAVSAAVSLIFAIAAGTLAGCAVLRPRVTNAQTTADKAAHRAGLLDDILSMALTQGAGSSPGWYWQTDPQGRLTAASDGLAAGLGRPVKSLMGQSFASLFAADETGSGWHRLVLAIEAQKPMCSAVRLPMRGAYTWWHVTTLPFTAANGRPGGMLGVARNISKERAELRRLSDDIAAATRLGRRKSRFLAAVAAELRGPLNTILGFSEHLLSGQDGESSPHLARCHLETILQSAHQLQQIVTVISDTTRIEKRQLKLVEQECDAAEIAEVTVKMCRELSEKAEVTLVASLIDGIELHCDVTRIKQALKTLVATATAWTPAGDTVHVNLELSAGGDLIISVDTKGAGLLLADPAELFEPYCSRTASPPDSTGTAGLGLPIARQIALLHGGDVTVEGADGNGVTFRLLLPPARVTVRSASSFAIDPAA